METNTATQSKRINIRQYATLFPELDQQPGYVSRAGNVLLIRKRWIRVCNHMLKSQRKATIEPRSDFELLRMGNEDLRPVYNIYKEATLWLWRHLVWELIRTRRFTAGETECKAVNGQNAFRIIKADFNTGEMRVQEIMEDGSTRQPITTDGPEYIPQLSALLDSAFIPIRKGAWEAEPDIVAPELPRIKPPPEIPERKRPFKKRNRKVKDPLAGLSLPAEDTSVSSYG